MELIKVSANSVTKSVAGAIAARLRDFGETEVHAVGARAVNQAVKSLIIARSYCNKSNVDLYIQPDFCNVDCNGTNIVSIKMYVKQIPLAEGEV